MKNQMVEFMVVQETGLAPFAELPDRRATTLRLFWTDEFEEDDDTEEKSSFETATAATQLKFTGVPWTPEQVKDQMQKIMEFHRTIAETVDFDKQEKENAGSPDKIEGLNLLVDDAIVGSPAERIDQTWEEIHEDFEVSGVSQMPFRYAGIRRYCIQVSETAKMYLHDTSEALEKITAKFFETTGIIYKPMKNPRCPNPRRFNKTAMDEFTEKINAKEEFTPGIFKDIAVSFVLAVAYSNASTRPDISEVVNYLETQFCKWSVEDDVILVRFIRATCGNVLLSVVDSRDRRCAQELMFPDASWASSKELRSRLGEAIYIVGRHTLALAKWGTNTMKTVACASQECEAGALQKVTKDGLVIGEMMKAFLMLRVVMKNGREDNQGLIKCLRKGGISVLYRRLWRTLGERTALSWRFYRTSGTSTTATSRSSLECFTQGIRIRSRSTSFPHIK